MLQAPEIALLAEIEVAAGRLDEARVAGDQLGSIADETQLPHVRGLAEYVAGLVCAAADEPAALGHLEAALPCFVAAGLPLEEASTRMAIARLLAESNPDVAIAEARAALDVCERINAASEADAAASLLRSLGSTGRAAARSGGALTGREAEVLQLLAEGLSNEQIAQRLFISKRTVEHHVGAILAKLGMSSRAEAIAHALHQGTGERSRAPNP